MKSYLFCFILESATVRREMEVVLRGGNDVQVDDLTVVDFGIVCGLSCIFLFVSRGCYCRLVFHCWLLIFINKLIINQQIVDLNIVFAS